MSSNSIGLLALNTEKKTVTPYVVNRIVCRQNRSVCCYSTRKKDQYPPWQSSDFVNHQYKDRIGLHSAWLPLLIALLRSSFSNRPFYSCVLSSLAMNASEAGVDLVLIETSLFLLCKSSCSYANQLAFTWEKQRGLYQNKVNSSLAAIQKPGHWAITVKWSIGACKAFGSHVSTCFTIWLISVLNKVWLHVCLLKAAFFSSIFAINLKSPYLGLYGCHFMNFTSCPAQLEYFCPI